MSPSEEIPTVTPGGQMPYRTSDTRECTRPCSESPGAATCHSTANYHPWGLSPAHSSGGETSPRTAPACLLPEPTNAGLRRTAGQAAPPRDFRPTRQPTLQSLQPWLQNGASVAEVQRWGVERVHPWMGGVETQKVYTKWCLLAFLWERSNFQIFEGIPDPKKVKHYPS